MKEQGTNSTPFWQEDTPLLLGSGSRTRRGILEAAGIPLEIIHPHVDEAAIAATLVVSNTPPREIAVALAHAKGEAISRLIPAARLILTADQTLDLDGQLLMKPQTRAQAAIHLSRLRGTTHHLHSAAVLRRGETILWAGVQSASLRMRNLSDTFILHYLDEMGALATQSVGSYQIEGLGAQLFDEIDGEHTTILGLPIFPVLHALRDCGALPE